MANKILQNLFIKQMMEKYGDEYTLVGDLVDFATKITIMHNTCNRTFEAYPHNFLRKNRRFSACTHCSKEERDINREQKRYKKKGYPKSRIRKNTITTDIYKQRLKEKVGDEYSLIGEYIKSNVKVRMRHNTCGHEWDIMPVAFMSVGNRCPMCSRYKKSTEEFSNEVHTLTNGEYEVIGEYIAHDAPINIRHSICGHEYTTRPEFFIKGMRCPECNQRRQVKHDEFIQRVYDLHKDNITVIGEYKAGKSYIKIRNNKCNHEYEMIARSLLLKTLNQRNDCPVCRQLRNKEKEKRAYDRLQNKLKKQSEKKPKKGIVTGHKSFVNKVRELKGDEFEVLGTYERANKKIELRHNQCGRTFMVTPGGFLNRPTCRPCSEYRNHAYTTEEFSRLISENTSGEYEVIGEYINGLTPVTVKHKCGHIYDITPDSLRLKRPGSMCPACSNSSVSLGEVRIKNFLDSHNIKYKQQYGIDECRNKHRLSFDFAVFHKEGALKCLIEFDGEQHFNVVEYFGKESTERTQYNDKIKNEYCKKNNIHLIRIPYWNRGNIDEILTNELSSYKIYIQNNMTAS